jgi:formylglycine-generating enzyme required for sulfatase activity
MPSEAPRAALAAALLALAWVAAPAHATDAACRSPGGPVAARDVSEGMAWIPGGVFTMGEDRERPEERPLRRVALRGFWIDRHEVTNAQFARFVAATGYVTVAERGLDPAAHPHLPPELLRPGGLVFRAPERIADRSDVGQWWSFVPGASWRHPEGPASDIGDRQDHPVVQVAWEDALHLGRDLPARRGLAREFLAGRFPLGRYRRGWLSRHRPRLRLPAQRLRPVRHGGERLGTRPRLVDSTP